jgi:transcription-repair coupling factor (superfamily II helicase)
MNQTTVGSKSMTLGEGGLTIFFSLLPIVAIKALARRANVEKIEAGPKGVVLAFRDNTFADPDGLVRYIRDRGPSARVRPDMKVVFFEDWERPDARLKGTAKILRSLVTLAEPAKAA